MSTVQRKHLRAPVNAPMLYVCEDHVLPGRCFNLSVGGVLIGDLGRVPTGKEFNVLIGFSKFPELSTISTSKIMNYERDSFGLEVMRFKVKLVRSFEKQSSVDKVLLSNIGAEFVSPTSEQKQSIDNYVTVFAKNIIYLLTLFEGVGESQKNVLLLRKVAAILGYPAQEKVAILRQQVLHDYQSLEAL